jgi:hypothetical protein
MVPTSVGAWLRAAKSLASTQAHPNSDSSFVILLHPWSHNRQKGVATVVLPIAPLVPEGA